MNTTTRMVLRHFLGVLYTMIDDPKVTEIDPFFRNFFTREELIDIIRFMYDGPALTMYDLSAMNGEELLDTIGDNAIILDYYFKQWDQDRVRRASLEPEEVWNTLEQLGLETHYLGRKIVAEWDDYDQSNYHALQLKAGKIIQVYGIYDINITERQAASVTSPPKRFYDSKDQAELALEEIISQRGFSKDELHVLPLYVAT